MRWLLCTLLLISEESSFRASFSPSLSSAHLGRLIDRFRWIKGPAHVFPVWNQSCLFAGCRVLTSPKCQSLWDRGMSEVSFARHWPARVDRPAACIQMFGMSFTDSLHLVSRSSRRAPRRSTKTITPVVRSGEMKEAELHCGEKLPWPQREGCHGNTLPFMTADFNQTSFNPCALEYLNYYFSVAGLHNLTSSCSMQDEVVEFITRSRIECINGPTDTEKYQTGCLYVPYIKGTHYSTSLCR